MGQLRQALNMIRAQVSRLTTSQRLLLASLAVIAAMTLFLVAQYAGRGEMVELAPGLAADAQQRVVTALQVAGVRHEVRNGRVLVPADRKHLALAQLSQAGALPDDSSLLFSNIVDKQSWAMSADQRRQMERLALQNELALTIAQMDGVRSAKVLIDAPAPSGLGSAVRRPTAAVTVFTDGGGAVSQRTVDAVAAFVAGAKAGLEIENVRVIDGSTNTQRRPTGDDDAVASTNFERTKQVESRVRGKLLDLLAYIDGVIVAVNAQVDTRRVSTERREILPAGAGSQVFALSETSSEESQSNAGRGGEAGVRSNTGLDINRGSASGSEMSRSESKAELRPEVGYQTQRIDDPRGIVTKLNATINVPRSYFVARWREAQPAGDADGAQAEPTEEDLQPIMEREIARITADVQPLVDTPEEADGPGTVVVSMIPDWKPAGLAGEAGLGAALGLGGGSGVTIPGLVKTVALGALALVSLGLMARTLRKANQPIELPTAEELVGVPPVVRGDDSAIGDAAEVEGALAGVELTQEEIDRRKMLEQVQSLIKTSPKDAAMVMNKWIAAEE
ncbi:MAG: hypothetical protein D6693_02525 [Planctomycetota bacterium]|nr:MAG: hypothetical protein D6693_02525 [Planctomycetota bacterium]